ncbi:MAG: DNA polymerase III subunit beta [Pirellulales bacterium]|nr:DNA polymerase III subunit beta [Pirellulales bacterium]
MKLKLPRSEFANAFAIAAQVAPVRSPKPILQNVKFIARVDGGELLATDLEVGVRIRVSGLTVDQPGETVLPIARFRNVLADSHDDELELSVTDSGALVKGKSSRIKLATESVAEFPSIADFAESRYHQVPCRVMRELIRRTVYATDNESSRYALGGVLLELTAEKVTAVGTDGRRLAKMEGPASAVGEQPASDQPTIVPTRALQVIERAIGDEGDIKLAARGNDLVVCSEKITLITRLVEGRFPRWRDVFPHRPSAPRIELPAGALADSVKQAAIVTSDESRGVSFRFTEGKLSLQASTAQVGEADVEQVISYSGPELKISLDPRYVLDFLKVLPVEQIVTFELAEGVGPAVLFSDDGRYSYVVMPLNRDR